MYFWYRTFKKSNLYYMTWKRCWEKGPIQLEDRDIEKKYPGKIFLRLNWKDSSKVKREKWKILAFHVQRSQEGKEPCTYVAHMAASHVLPCAWVGRWKTMYSVLIGHGKELHILLKNKAIKYQIILIKAQRWQWWSENTVWTGKLNF